MFRICTSVANTANTLVVNTICAVITSAVLSNFGSPKSPKNAAPIRDADPFSVKKNSLAKLLRLLYQSGSYQSAAVITACTVLKSVWLYQATMIFVY